MVAWEEELLGWVTGLDVLDGDVLEEWLLELVLSSPSPEAWEPVVLEPVDVDPEDPLSVWLAVAVWADWVVRPRPTAAPRALTTLSPARPAWSRRLRLRGVMASPSARALCLPCEGPGVVVSVSCRQPDSERWRVFGSSER